MKRTHAIVAVALLSTGCGGKGAASPSTSRDPLVGRWSAAVPGAPCAFEVELMEGGNARTNFLSDDDPAALCRHHDVTYSVGTPAQSTLLFMAGERAVRYCSFARTGEYLDLACDEHGLPSPGTPPIRFSRLAEATETTGSTAQLTGDWRDGTIRLTFLPGGVGLLRDQKIGYRVLSDSELELEWPQREKCGYTFRGNDELLLKCASMSLDLKR